MAKDVSIVFKASDNLSNSIRQMRKSVDGLSKDVTEYRKIQSQAFDKRTEVKFDMSKAKKELKDLERAVKENKDGSEKAFKDKAKSLEMLQEEYRRLGQVAKDASKAERGLQEEMSKTSNKNASRGMSQFSMLNGLARAGLGNMLGNAVQNSLFQNVTSTYGSTTGAFVSNMAGDAISGAAIGSMAGPIGAAVGAAVGGLTGAINAFAEKQKKEDDYFRQEIQDLYGMAKQERTSSLENGTEKSSNAEQNIMALETLLGTEEKAKKMYEDIRLFGLNTPYKAPNMLDSSKQMLAYGIKEENIMNDIRRIGEVAMGNQAKFDSLSYVYAQTQSAGKLNGQDLRQYTEAGFNPLKVLAEEAGTTLQAMRDKMSAGLISAEDVTRAFEIATSEGGQFYGAMAKQMETYAGKLSMLNDIKGEIDKSMGDGYTEERQKGMEKEIEQLNGEVGEKMKEAYNMIGKAKADLENQHQQAIIDAIVEAQKSTEYMDAKRLDDEVKMGEIMSRARIKGEIEFKNSEGYKLQQEADLALVTSVQEDAALNGAYIDYGRKMGDAFSQGYSGAVNRIISSPIFAPSQKKTAVEQSGNIFHRAILNAQEKANRWDNKNGYATGLGRVPEDGYYKLHAGEKIETRVDADKHSKAIYITNHFSISNKANAEEITKEICINVSRAMEEYVGGR